MITPYTKDHKYLHQTRETLFRAGLMSLCPKEEGKVVAEQPVPARELSISNTHTKQQFPPERGLCTPQAPQLQYSSTWVRWLKEKTRPTSPFGASRQHKLAQHRELWNPSPDKVMTCPRSSS